MLRLEDVSLVYNLGRADQLTALNGIDACFPDAQFCTVVGSNGAGKSSLLNVIAGFERATQGYVSLDGKDITRQADYRRAHQIARIFDNPGAGTVAELSVEDNLALAMKRGQSRRLSKAVTGRRRDRMRAALAPLGLGLEERLRDRVGLLSAGQRQSLTMAMASLTRPAVLLLDEHVAALDPNTQRRVMRITVDIVSRMHCTVLMVTHNVRHALEFGDRLLVMGRGRIVGDFAGERKAHLTVDDVVETLSRAGEVLPDRSLLDE